MITLVNLLPESPLYHLTKNNEKLWELENRGVRTNLWQSVRYGARNCIRDESNSDCASARKLKFFQHCKNH